MIAVLLSLELQRVKGLTMRGELSEVLADTDLSSRNDIISSLLPQVRQLAQNLQKRLPASIEVEDLVQAGVVGLIQAVERYDPRRIRLEAYATFRIRGAMLDSLRENDWGTRQLRCFSRRIENAKVKLQNELGRLPTEEDLASELRMRLPDLHAKMRQIAGLKLQSLQTRAGENPWETKEIEVPAKEDPLQLCLESEMKGLVLQWVDDLPQQEREVVYLYYFRELNMKEVASMLGVGESRISQIHSVAVNRLRTRVQKMLSAGPLKPKSCDAKPK